MRPSFQHALPIQVRVGTSAPSVLAAFRTKARIAELTAEREEFGMFANNRLVSINSRIEELKGLLESAEEEQAPEKIEGKE